MRINKSVFKYIEHELYNYEQTKKDLLFYRAQIIEGVSAPEVNVQSRLGDVTANKAIKLVSSAFIGQAERVIGSIDKALIMLGEKHKRLFKLKYQDGLPWQEVMIEMEIGERSYFRLRRELVIMVGQQLGVLNVEQNWQKHGRNES